MSMPRSVLLILPVSLLACSSGKTPYYPADGTPPKVTSIVPDSEPGNTGGGLISIEGSALGAGADLVTVQFGDQNAEVISADSSRLIVRAPKGPLGGGKVPVKIGTRDGVWDSGDYAYEVNQYWVDEDQGYGKPLGYVALTNDYTSCYAGITNSLGDSQADFCRTFAWTGTVGLEGRAEFMDFAFPGIQLAHAGYRGGFGGNHDISWNAWSVQTPAQSVNTFDLEDLYEHRRVDIGKVTLTNEYLSEFFDENDDHDRDFCVDDTQFAEWRYSGGDAYEGDDEDRVGEVLSAQTFFNDEGFLDEEARDEDSGECASYATAYRKDQVEFCQVDDYDDPRYFVYEADYRAGSYFFTGDFRSEDKETPQMDVPVPITVDIPKAGISGVEIELPATPEFDATEGGNGESWALYGLGLGCPIDEDGNPAGYEGSVLRWEWEPADFPEAQDLPDGVVNVRSYVKVNLSMLTIGWLGGDANPIRMSMTVPDSDGVIDIPAEMFWRLPSNDFNSGESQFGGFIWGEPGVTEYSYSGVTIERVTEYVLDAKVDGQRGTVVLAYSTGDLALQLLDNPLDGGSCGDCSDNDGDGWIDNDDPDCTDGDNEDDSTFGQYLCNDGIDNDADGLIDSEDDDCGDGFDRESTCTDGSDNDGDGWTDDDDPDCDQGDEEDSSFDGTTTCTDGLDNDADGDIDVEDADCTSGLDDETNCANGIDDDLDGWTDEEDGECGDQGSGFELGEDDPSWECVNGLDDDADGWADFEDPDCISPYDEEVGYGTTACNDGADNDGHGDVDADDLLCAIKGATYESEAPNLGSECDDATDNDADGYADGNDPDCEVPPHNFETATSQSASEFPTVRECYNGVDDDGEGDADSLDPGCADGGTGSPDGFDDSEDSDNL